MKKLKKSASKMVAEAKSRIQEIPAVDLIGRVDDPNLVIVDIRDPRERERLGAIPGAVHAPRGMVEFWVDPESPYFKPVFDQPGKEFVFHCAAGWRSALMVATLQDMGFDAAHMTDGFAGWVENGGPVEPKG